MHQIPEFLQNNVNIKKSKKSDNANHWVLRYFVCEAMHVQQLNARHTAWNAKETTTTTTQTAAAGFYVF